MNKGMRRMVITLLESIRVKAADLPNVRLRSIGTPTRTETIIRAGGARQNLPDEEKFGGRACFDQGSSKGSSASKKGQKRGVF